MKYPKMILFDYGDTLLYEPDWDSVRGNEELLKYVTKNPNNCTLEDVRKGAELIFGDHIESIRKIGYDISGQVGNKVLYEYLGIEFSLTPLEMETVFWNGASMGAIMPNSDKMLDYINKNGIRSAVISNLLWSGDALTDIALRKAGVSSGEIWYCGDNPQADIEGASQVGIYPVWYDNDTGKDCKDRSNERLPQCEHLHIHEWNEMIDLLEKIKI